MREGSEARRWLGGSGKGRDGFPFIHSGLISITGFRKRKRHMESSASRFGYSKAKSSVLGRKKQYHSSLKEISCHANAQKG